MNVASGATPLLSLACVALDTETTALDARTARVVQVGAVRVAGAALLENQRFQTLVNPGAPIPRGSTLVHGVTDAMVASAPSFVAIESGLREFINGAIIIGHAIGYDIAVLRREYQIAGREAPFMRALDVRLLARIASPTLADHGLDALCDWLGIAIEGRHTAIGDAMAAAKVFAALLPRLRARNIRTLAEADAACAALAAREVGAYLDDLAPSETSAAPMAFAGIDSFAYGHRISELMSSPPVTAPPDMTVRAAMRLLLERRVSSVFVRDAAGKWGIVTERDLLRALDTSGETALTGAIGSITRAHLQTVHEHTFVYRAIARMERMGFRHLGVHNDAGDIVGAVTPRNLLRHRASTALVLGDEIDFAANAVELAVAWAKMPLVAGALLGDNVDARTTCAVISAEIRNMTRRAVELAEQRMLADGQGSPPAPYTVLVLGSAGRGESLLAADQDNAIIYANSVDVAAIDPWFKRLAEHFNETLDAAGIPFCKGGVMARNADWRKPVAGWLATIDDWVGRQNPADLLNVDIFFDAVPVHGDGSLAGTISEHAWAAAHAARDFQNLLIETARRRDNPMTILGNFRTDENGRFDLKRYGLMPIFTAARVLAIRTDVRAGPTAERFRGAMARGVGSTELVETILDAHRVIAGAMIAQQLEDAKRGLPLSSKVDPRRLSKKSRTELKRALSNVEEAIGLVSEGRI